MALIFIFVFLIVFAFEFLIVFAVQKKGRLPIRIVMNFWKNVKLSWPSQVPRPSCELGNLTRLTPRNYDDLWPMVAFAILVISTFQISQFMTIIAT